MKKSNLNQSILKINNTNSIKVSLISTLIVFNIILLIWYQFFGYQLFFHSDSAVKVLIAREILLTGEYFPSDWNYANSDLFVFFGHTFIVPLLAFLPAGFTAHAIAGLIFSILLLSGVWLVTGIPKVGYIRRLLIMAVATSGISEFMAENLYGQVSYGLSILYSTYLIFFSWKSFEVNKKFSFWHAALLTMTILVFWSNPVRSILYYGIPLIFSMLWLIYGKKVSRKKIYYTFFIFLVGIFIGSFFSFYSDRSSK